MHTCQATWRILAVSVLLSLSLLSETKDVNIGLVLTDSPGYIIDTLVVVDSVVFTRWLSLEPLSKSLSQRQADATTKIRVYISQVIDEANNRLQTLDNFSLQMSVAEMLINMHTLDSVPRIGSSKQIDSAIALDTLKSWVIVEGHAKSFDHVLLLTGMVFASPTGTVSNKQIIKGRAYIGEMCNTNGLSVSVVNDRGDYQSSAATVAHEIAHSVGSEHDGQGSSSECSSADHYIMTTEPEPPYFLSNLYNPWQFSACSSTVIGKFVGRPEASCLTTNLPADQVFIDTQGSLPGLQNDGNKQCQLIHGGNSRMCLGDGFPPFEKVCTSMWCMDVTSTIAFNTVRCVQYQAAEGTPCGNGQMCQKGRCVKDSRAPAIMENVDCPFGDSVIPIHGAPCHHYAVDNPSICYQGNYRSLCCATCQAIKTSSQVCPFGDRKSGCEKEYCQSIRSDGSRYDEDCCGTCSYDTPAACVDVESLDGKSCSEHLQNGVSQSCYNGSFAYHCCQSCADLRTGPKDCEYGDWTVDNTCNSLTLNGQRCSSYADQCCQTCSNSNPDPNTSIRGHRSSHCLVISLAVIGISFLFIFGDWRL